MLNECNACVYVFICAVLMNDIRARWMGVCVWRDKRKTKVNWQKWWMYRALIIMECVESSGMRARVYMCRFALRFYLLNWIRPEDEYGAKMGNNVWESFRRSRGSYISQQTAFHLSPESGGTEPNSCPFIDIARYGSHSSERDIISNGICILRHTSTINLIRKTNSFVQCMVHAIGPKFLDSEWEWIFPQSTRLAHAYARKQRKSEREAD